MSAAGEGGANGIHEILAPVADDGLERDGDADLIELFSEVKGVGVLAVGGEHLGANGDDFGFHKAAHFGFSFQPVFCTRGHRA